MPDPLPIIDAHAHVIPRVCGRNRFGALSSESWGVVRRGQELVPLLPPTCARSTFPVEALIQVMEREGVSQAVLVQNPTLGIFNEYIQECIARFPGRFCGAIQVDPRSPKASAVIRRFASPSQNSLKLEMSHDWGWTGLYPDFRINEAGTTAMWDTVAECGLEVIIDPGDSSNPGYQVEDFADLISRMPSTRFLLEHLGYPLARLQADRKCTSRRRQMLELACRPNVWLGLSAVPILLEESYPCPGSVDLLREAVEMVGAQKLIWGSDLPTTLNLHTYRQLVDTVRREATFLSQEQSRQILHGNAKCFFKGLAGV